MKELMTVTEASNYLNVKISWLRTAIFKKEVPFVKLKKLVRFRKIDLENYIQKNLKKESQGEN